MGSAPPGQSVAQARRSDRASALRDSGLLRRGLAVRSPRGRSSAPRSSWTAVRLRRGAAAWSFPKRGSHFRGPWQGAVGKQNPGAGAPGFGCGGRPLRMPPSVSVSEVVVQTSANDVGLELAVRSREGRIRVVGTAEIDIKIFDLGAPRPGDVDLDAAAQRPAGIGLVAAAQAGDRRLDIADGE